MKCNPVKIKGNTTIKNLKDAGVGILNTFFFLTYFFGHSEGDLTLENHFKL